MAAYTISWEPLARLLDDGLDGLSRASFNETWRDSTSMTYDPDWKRYQRMEDENLMRVLAAREGDRLVGYAAVILAADLHDRKFMTAFISDIYIQPPHNGLALLRYAERVLTPLGARQIVSAQRVRATGRRSLGKIYRFLGFRCNEVLWTKPLGAV